jgi:hypothetical protein
VTTTPLGPVVSNAGQTVRYTYRLKDFRPKVRIGQTIQTGDALAVYSLIPSVSVLNLATQLGRNARVARRAASFEKGSFVTQGEPLAEASGRFGLGRREVTAPVSGLVEAFVEDPGVLVIRPDKREETVLARFPARVVDINERGIDVEVSGRTIRAMRVRGVPVSGTLAVVSEETSVSDALRSAIDAADLSAPRIIAFHSPIDHKLAHLVREAYWRPDQVAIVCPAVAYDDFERESDPFPGLTVMAIEGYGAQSFGSPESDPIWRTIMASEGKEAIVLPREGDGESLLVLPAEPMGAAETTVEVLHPGTVVRFIHGLEIDHGTVVEVPDDETWLPSGYRAKAALVALTNSTVVLVPQANLEVVSAGTES